MSAYPLSIARGPVLWWLNWWRFDGIALPPFGVFIRAEKMADERLRRHEGAHWAQAQRMGAVRFYATYIWYTLRYGYHANPLELEARAAETP